VDNWIPSHTDFKILTPAQNASTITYVQDRILPDGSRWNTELLSNIFLLIDISAIEQIPIINTSKSDEIMWMQEPDGIYSVKSGYQTIQMWKNRSNREPKSSHTDTTISKKLWALNTIPRHKTILWRILTNALPLRSELGKMGILCSPLCPRCNVKLETTNHVFMTCPLITKTWFGSSLNLKILDQPITNFTDWISHSIQHQKEDIMVQIAAITYNIWHARNISLFKNRNIPDYEIAQ
jgi:hypothetical protein